MVGFFDKIVNFFSELDDYEILRQEKGDIIIGTAIKIIQRDQYTNYPFGGGQKDIDKEFTVFFLVSMIETRPSKLHNIFKKHKWPVFIIPQYIKSFEMFEKEFDNFIKKNYY